MAESVPSSAAELEVLVAEHQNLRARKALESASQGA